jgi:arsenate reductase (thioredoxin)
MSDKAASEPLRDIELFIDQHPALKSAAARLHAEFADTFDLETIDQFLYSSYDQLTTVQEFLALLAERFARQRMRALAKVPWRGSTSTSRCPTSAFEAGRGPGPRT